MCSILAVISGIRFLSAVKLRRKDYCFDSHVTAAMGNLRNAKCEGAKGNLRNHVRKMRAKNG